MAGLARDRQLNKHRIARIAFKLEFYAHHLVFIADISEAVQGQFNASWGELGKPGGDRRMKENRSIFGKDLRTE